MFDKKLAFSAVSVALGIGAFVKTQQITKEYMDPVVEACTSSNTTAFEEKYHTYEPMLGGAFVCIITQFIYDLTQEYPAGLLLWGATMLTAIPALVLTTVEAGRSGVTGPVRYPTVVGILGQAMGISTVFPLLWVPGYCFGRSTPQGTVSLTRARIALLAAMPFVILTILTFTLDSTGYAWTFVVGYLAGPAAAMTPLLTWNMTPPEELNSGLASKTMKTIAMSYIYAAIIAWIGWVFLVYIAWIHYGTDVSAFWADAWAEANPSVAFMAIDAIVFYLALVIYIAYCRLSGALEALVLTPLFGPGTACALVMSQLEMERVEIKTKKA